MNITDKASLAKAIWPGSRTGPYDSGNGHISEAGASRALKGQGAWGSGMKRRRY